MGALLCAALAAAGCGLGSGEGVGDVSLTVTRDFGTEPLVGPVREAASESDTVMRLLDRNSELSTRYGGGFVSSIDGLAEATEDGRRKDWFFFVNGVESPVGAAELALRGGESIWWDYRDWSTALYVPAVVGAWPEPLTGGYGGERRPVALECHGAAAACGVARKRLDAAGVELAAGSPENAIRVMVGPWERLREDPAAAQLERGPQASGVYAEFVHQGGGTVFRGLNQDGVPAREFGPDAGLVAATRRYDAPPVWIVSGVTPRGALAAAGLLDAAKLRDHYAVASEAGEETPLPVLKRSVGER